MPALLVLFPQAARPQEPWPVHQVCQPLKSESLPPELEDFTIEPGTLSLLPLDAFTLEPIPGAELTVHREFGCPIPGRWEPVRTATSGRNGWIRMSLRELPKPHATWFCLKAPGYSTLTSMTTAFESGALLMHPGSPVSVKVEDPLGSPMPGVLLEWMLGCGHTPSVVSVETDATGRATIGPIDAFDGDLWVVAPGRWCGGWDLDPPLRGHPESIITLPRGVLYEGQVVTEAGAPVPDVFVGQPVVHRGPWTRTGPDGRFRLVAGEAGGLTLRLSADEWQDDRDRYFSYPNTLGHPLLITLPESWDERDLADAPCARLLVSVWSNGAPVPEAKVWALRSSDGWCAESNTDASGAVLLAVPSGTFSVSASDPVGLARRHSDSPVTISKDSDHEVSVSLGPLRRLDIEVLGPHSEATGFGLVTPKGVVPLSPVTAPSSTLLVPADPAAGPTALRVAVPGRRPREFPIDWQAAGAVTVTPEATQPLRVRAETPTGESLLTYAHLAVRPYASSVAQLIEAPLAREHRFMVIPSEVSVVHIVPENPAWSPVVHAVTDADLAAGSLVAVCPPRFGRLVVETPDDLEGGRPYVKMSIDQATEVAIELLGSYGLSGGTAPIPSGGNRGIAERRGFFPLRFVTGEEPVTTVRWPLRDVVFEGRGENGEAHVLRWVRFSGTTFWGRLNSVVVRGLPYGRHLVVAKSAGGDEHAYLIDIPETPPEDLWQRRITLQFP